MKQNKEYEILSTHFKRLKKKNIYWGVVYGIITISILILLFRPLMSILLGWFSLIGITWMEYTLTGIIFCAYLWGIPYLIQRIFYRLKLLTSEDALLVLKAQLENYRKKDINQNSNNDLNE